MKIPAPSLVALGLLALASFAGCAAPAEDGAPGSSEDALTEPSLRAYGMSVGIVSTGADARALFDAIKSSGGVESDAHVVAAGMTALELGLAAAGEDDADQVFGIACQAAEGDRTFQADTCSLNAVVEMKAQGKRGVVLTGKLARAVAGKLPRTSPEGLVGSTTFSSGRISCEVIPGPAGATCIVKAAAVTQSFAKMSSGDEAPLSAADAKKVIETFFPSS